MANDKYILAVDHGTSGVKTSLVSTRGETVGSEFEKTPICFSKGGGAEQDPQDWWDGLINTCRKLVEKGLVPARDIIAVCCSSTFSSTVAVGEDGKHLMNSLTWMDSRGAPYIKNKIGGFPSVMGYNVFLMLPWIIKTAGGPQLSGKDDIAHMLFVQHELPDIYKKTKMFLGSKDYLNLRLTGKFAASYDAMALFWVVNTRDINNMHYDDKLIKILGIDKDKLPPMMYSTDVLGDVSEDVAKQIGIPNGVKVVMGSPDHQSACIGSGAVRDFEGHLYIGTSSWIQCIVPFKKTDVFHSIATLPTSIPGKYYCANEQDVAGGCLSFFVDKIMFPENEIRPEEAPSDIYGKIDEFVKDVPPGSNKLIFTPWLNGERTPVDDTTVRAGLFNMSMSTTNAEIARSVMEGVAYNTKWALGYVEKFIGRKMDTINIVGGGGKSDVWCQIFADVMDRRIRQVKDPMQANARGAAFIASVGLGHITFDDIPGLVQYKNVFEPDQKNRGTYDELYKEFLQIYKNNRAMYARMNKPH
jgi:xylulokinase